MVVYYMLSNSMLSKRKLHMGGYTITLADQSFRARVLASRRRHSGRVRASRPRPSFPKGGASCLRLGTPTVV